MEDPHSKVLDPLVDGYWDLPYVRDLARVVTLAEIEIYFIAEIAKVVKAHQQVRVRSKEVRSEKAHFRVKLGTAIDVEVDVVVTTADDGEVRAVEANS